MTRARLFATVVTVALLLGGCGGDESRLSAEDLKGRVFTSTSVTGNGKPYPMATGTHLFIHFGDGRFSANAGCNDMSAAFDVDDDKLVLEDGMESTLASCNERDVQDVWVGKLLGSEPRVELSPGRLVLTAGDRRVELREHDLDTKAVLVGPTWLLTAIVSDGRAAPATSSVPLVFQEDGSFVNGTADCPAATGHVEFHRGAVRGDTSAEGTCPVPEGNRLVPLGGWMTVEQAGDVVRFRAPSGTGFDLRPAP